MATHFQTGQPQMIGFDKASGPDMTVIRLTGTIKQIPLNILARPISEEYPNEPLHQRLVGFNEALTEVYFSLQMFMVDLDSIRRVKTDMPEEGCIVDGIFLVSCSYLARVFPEMKDSIMDMRDAGIKYMLAIMPTEGEA